MEDQNTINQSVLAQPQNNKFVHYASKQTYNPVKTEIKTEDNPTNDDTTDTTHEAQKFEAKNVA